MAEGAGRRALFMEDEHPVVASMCEGCKFKRNDQIIKPGPRSDLLEQKGCRSVVVLPRQGARGEESASRRQAVLQRRSSLVMQPKPSDVAT